MFQNALLGFALKEAKAQLTNLQVAVLDEKGKVLNNSRVDNNLMKVNEFFDRLHPKSNTKVVMESSGMWYDIYESCSYKEKWKHITR